MSAGPPALDAEELRRVCEVVYRRTGMTYGEAKRYFVERRVLDHMARSNSGSSSAVPGAARKTANVVLGTSFGIASGVVVDTHVLRIAGRLDLTQNTDPVHIEQDLMKIIPQDRWILFSHQLIHHGRSLCVARKPKCAECKLNPLCYAPDKNYAPDKTA